MSKVILVKLTLFLSAFTRASLSLSVFSSPECIQVNLSNIHQPVHSCELQMMGEETGKKMETSREERSGDIIMTT